MILFGNLNWQKCDKFMNEKTFLNETRNETFSDCTTASKWKVNFCSSFSLIRNDDK